MFLTWFEIGYSIALFAPVSFYYMNLVHNILNMDDHNKLIVAGW